MKSTTRSFVLIVLVALQSVILRPQPATAASSAAITAAVEKGLVYLHGSQTADGYWSYGGYEPAATGAAVFAMLVQKGRWDANAAQYQADVDEGIAYLLAVASTTTVSTRNDGANICPAGSGTCLGISWQAYNNEDTYTTGIIAQAIGESGFARAGDVATTTGPLAGLTWGDIAQGITNMYAASQSTALNGNRRGGWRYYLPGNGDSDMSTTQWAIIAMLYDQSVGATVPQVVKDDLQVWLAAVQAPNGSGCYQPGPDDPANNPCDHSDTGGLLLGLNLVGKPSTDPAVQLALGFLNANWPSTASGTWYGNFGHPYAMLSVYKGLETTIGRSDRTCSAAAPANAGAPCATEEGCGGTTGVTAFCVVPKTITNLRPGQCGGDSSSPCNWWEDYNDWLVSAQNADGSWSGYAPYWTGVLATGFNLAILKPGAVVPSATDHFQCYRVVDSKGNSCTAAAPTNAGAACETEEDCGGTTDETAFCVPKAFTKLQVQATDQFGAHSLTVNKPAVLCNPASVDERAINDRKTHLEGYQVSRPRGEPKFKAQKDIGIKNEFHPNGELLVDVTKLQRLLVPTAKSVTGPVAALDPDKNDVDHFTCYAVKLSKGAPKFPTDLQVQVIDQFDQPRLYQVKGPKRLCAPADKNGEGVKNPETHLMCYKVTPLRGQPKFVRVPTLYVTNQFGREIDVATSPDDLCVPSSKILPNG